MVNLFNRVKIPSNLLFNDEPMFAYIFLFGKRMFRKIDSNVFSNFNPASFPTRIIWSNVFFKMIRILPFHFDAFADPQGRKFGSFSFFAGQTNTFFSFRGMFPSGMWAASGKIGNHG